MTKHGRMLIRSCISNGFKIRNKMQVLIGKNAIDWDRFNTLAEEVELALDKQEPVKPVKVSTNMYGFTIGFCGACGSPIGVDMKYCDKCGQRINWEEEENDG